MELTRSLWLEGDNLFDNDQGVLDDEGTDAWLIVSYSAWPTAGGDRVKLFYARD